MDMFYFTHSLKLVEKMCEQLKQPEIARKVNQYLSEKENKDIYIQQQRKTPQVAVTTQPQSSHINETRVVAPFNNAASVSFAEKAKNEKPEIFKSTQEVASNPFTKKEPATKATNGDKEVNIF